MSEQKIALVTGGNGGIGSAICQELADNGIKVIAGYYTPEKETAEKWQAEMRDAGYEFHLVAGDVANYKSAGEMINQAEAEVGPIDILVNCAGITRDKMLKRMTEDQWSAVISTNLDSVFNMTQQVINGMLERGYGRVINISSVNGQKGQFGQANYSAAKAGLHGFTMATAQETALKGVTVNTVSPGYIATAMTKAIAPEILDSITQTIPMRRMGEPNEIAHAVAWLADEKSAYVTGANIPVNGGLYMAA
jgi:acetoacetyl-CoA reductase